jgi:DNA-directed RNA polymerase subunit M/transcription elongation factor TFIIS
MHFCTECQNMYYTRLGGENLNMLIYYCRKCGHEDDSLSSDKKNIYVSKTHLKSSSASYHHMVNEYTKLDPTLPRIKNIPCPNVSCPSKNNDESKDSVPVENDIIYLRYDDNNLKYVYICSNCNTVWKTTNN